MKVLGVTKKEVDVKGKTIVLTIGGIRFNIRESQFMHGHLVVESDESDLSVKPANSNRIYLKSEDWFFDKKSYPS